MQTLDEAAFNVAIKLLEIGIDEGRLPNVTGLHSVQPIESIDGEVTVWLMHDAIANQGIIAVHLPESAIDGINPDDLLRRLTGWRPSSSLLERNNIDEWLN